MALIRNSGIIQQPQPRLAIKHDVANQLLRRRSEQSPESTSDTQNLTFYDGSQSPTSSTHTPLLPKIYRDVSDGCFQHPSNAIATVRENIADTPSSKETILFISSRNLDLANQEPS